MAKSSGPVAALPETGRSQLPHSATSPGDRVKEVSEAISDVLVCDFPSSSECLVPKESFELGQWLQRAAVPFGQEENLAEHSLRDVVSGKVKGRKPAVWVGTTPLFKHF